MELLYHPNDFLNKKLQLVNIEDPGFDPKEVLGLMTETMLKHKGIGLSASQVGMDAQLFVMGYNEKNTTLCINPTVLQHTKETVTEMEGCLSFPGIGLAIKRPKEILVQYYDENLERKEQKLVGYSVKVFLHEWDHLQGITFKDRSTPLKWKMAAKKANKIIKRNGH